MSTRFLGLCLLALSASACKPAIQNKGSDTMSDVAQAWAARYHELHPEVKVVVSGGGSGTGVSALINGTCDIANCSRQLEPKELEDAKAKNHEPKEFMVGRDAIAIFVHKDNPIASITLAQLADIYGKKGKTTKWSELGVKMPNAKDDAIVLVSRMNNSGTYHYFGEVVLKKEGFKLGTLDQSGSKDVVDCVAKNPAAIGYCGIAFDSKEVKKVPVVAGEGKAPVVPSIDSVLDGTYPIARPLYMYTIGEPKGDVKTYLDWVLSPEGQKVLVDAGYPPVHRL